MFCGKQIFVSVLFFASMISVFPSGSLLSSTKFEQYALTAASAAKTNTTNGDYLSLSVTSNESIKMPSGFSEAHELNGIFRGDNFNFSTTVNSSKKQVISIPELSSDINYSILYANTFSNRIYKDHYRHEYYPLELMFKGEHSVEKDDYSFCYVSQSQADVLLDKMSLEKSSDNYEKLICSKINIDYEGTICRYSIANIYLETNSFYYGLKSTMGDFVVTYAKHPESFKQSFNYYLNVYPFQNSYFLKRISSIYMPNEYSIELDTANIIKPFDSNTIIGFFVNPPKKAQNTLSIVLILITFVSFAISLLMFCLRKITIFIEHIFLYPGISLLIHFIFRIIYLSTNVVFCFSNFSTISFFIMEIIIISFLITLFLIQRRRAANE